LDENSCATEKRRDCFIAIFGFPSVQNAGSFGGEKKFYGVHYKLVQPKAAPLL